MTGQRFEIEGGSAISGTLVPSGNKNAALPLLAACLLTDETVTLRNVPDIRDVRVLGEVLEGLGATIDRGAPGVWAITARSVAGGNPDVGLARAIRASILLAGPMLARRGEVCLPPPGGDVIGRRRIDTHVLALEALGATFSAETTGLRFEAKGGLRGAEIFLDEASVTATENVIMAAVLAKGHTSIMNAASEPHVQDLCRLLVQMGAKIDGIGSNHLQIEGVQALGGADFELGPDYIEVGSFIVLAAVTGGALRIKDARPREHRATKLAMNRIGIDFHADGNDIVVPAEQRLEVRSDLFGAIPKIEDAPWPGFAADLTSIVVVGATQASGTVLIHEKLFESRLFFTDRLVAMGARLILCDPHRVVVTGRQHLVGADLVSPDIRAGMALLIAALCAEGKSVIHNIHQIDRGYQQIDSRLRALGAQISRVED